MASQRLTHTECLLLQRYYDGELGAAEEIEAAQLLERNAAARVFLRALEELSLAARSAGEVAWERAADKAARPEVIVELATSAADLSKAPLEELAPLLERFHDGEVDEAEHAFVTALLDERDDAVGYLAGLDEIGQGMRAAGAELAEGVDFSNFWNGIASQIEAPKTDQPGFEPAEHLGVVQRYFDGEVDAEEAACVERWLDEGDPRVAGYLEALEEIHLGVNAAADTACERAPIRDIWTGVQAGLDKDEAEVVSLGQTRRDRRKDQASAEHSWFGEYRQAIVGALAAAVVLAGLVGLFKDEIFGPRERVVVEKTVVVVDSVEYAPGSSVMIDSPTKQVSMDGEDSDKPTVIWLFDSGNDKGADEATGDQADTPAEDPDNTEAPDTDAGPDAGSKAPPQGQPI